MRNLYFIVSLLLVAAIQLTVGDWFATFISTSTNSPLIIAAVIGVVIECYAAYKVIKHLITQW